MSSVGTALDDVRQQGYVSGLSFGVFIGGLVGMALTLFLVWKINPVGVLRDEAVAHDKAEYYLDEHYERQWRWKP